MNYSSCNGWNEYAGTYEGAYYAEDVVSTRTAAAGGNCGNIATAAAAGTARSCDGTSRAYDLYWQGYMAEFYANNKCNQSAEAGTAAQAADRATAASNCHYSYNSYSSCGNWNSYGNCGNCRS